MQDFQVTEAEEQEVSIKEMVGRYLRYWPWMVLGVVLAVTTAFIYLRYTVPTYSTSARIIISDSNNGGASSEVAALQNLGVLNNLNTSSIENEVEILQSERLLKPVVENLGLNVEYYREGRIKRLEVYGEQPFKVKVLSYNTAVGLPASDLTFTLLDAETVSIADDKGIHDYALGEVIDLEFAEIMVVPNFDEEVLPESRKSDFQVHFFTIDEVAMRLAQEVKVMPSKKGSTVMEISLVHPITKKAEAIVNELIEQYNKDAIADNNLIAKNTSDFIESRLKIIAGELDSVETDKVDFKVSNRLVDVEGQASGISAASQEVMKAQLDLNTRISVIHSLVSYLGERDNAKLLPVNLGESGSSALVEQYNTLVMERNELRKHTTEKNPVLKTMDAQIDELRGTVLESLRTEIKTLEIALQDLKSRERLVDAKMAAAPVKEKQFRDIERQQSIKEALYLFLLEKREEASISMAINEPKAKVVNYARSSIKPVSPKKEQILGGAFVLGLIFPLLIVYVRELLNDKIQTRKDIESRVANVPIVGELPSVDDKEEQFIANDGRSILAESFRILRTNLQYMFIDREEGAGAKTILVTSTTKGEGKSLTAANLAISLAGTGKKVVLIGADLRNPQLGRYFEHDRNQTGLSNYLFKESIDLRDIVSASEVNGLDLITSGSIPPNPAELLLSKRTGELFDTLKQEYDYIVIDTAPLLLVTDTFLINKYADVVLYVMRSGYTEIRFTDFIKDTLKTKKLEKVALVLNDVSMADFGYGNKYGYSYYGRERETFFGKIKKRLSA
ncbi:GumC family protein [Robertkochia flava]|uniref:GumC family protein n=1 Tax=Robertkochia flava TaxID=3447986 RepID=UPI001CD02BAB|nr:polysaccharide biosynthesis tyrosine autokinase [Robertkochia marina]